jgi:predicted SAM-dependent methyltransferase
LTLKQRLGRWLFPRLPFTRFLFDVARFDVASWMTMCGNRLLPGRRRRLKAILGQRGLLVNVACGPHVLPEFLNIDLYAASPSVVRWDARRSIPLADGSAAGIRAEHFVEHLEPREEVPAFLSDCRRVLQPGGTLRVIVPDAGRYLEAYCRPDLSGFRELAVPDPFPSDLPTRMDVVNHVFHQWHEHRWGYDFEALAHRLRTAGFAVIEQRGYGDSRLPPLAQDRDVHAPYSLYFEATK